MKMNGWQEKWFEDCIKNGTFYIYYQRSSQSGITRYYKVFLVYNGVLNDITFFINRQFYNKDKREIAIRGHGISIVRKIEEEYGEPIEWQTF